MRWLRNCWQAAAFSHEVGQALLPRRFLDEAVILYRTAEGTPVALADKCAHRYAPLSLGRLVDDTVQCGYHGMCFDRSGTAVSVPGQSAPPANARVRSYPICERHTLVWIWMGDPAKADPDLVPDVHWFDDPQWTCVSGYHRFAANYRLLNDNLLDLSHESFVHTDTIGNRAVADSPVQATIVEGRYVKVHRFMAECDPPPFYVASTGFTTKIDRWHTSYYTPPGSIVIANGSMPAGCTDRSLAKERRVLNLVTPETATSSHYFWGVARKYDVHNPELDAFMLAEIARTFDQDKVMLEAQQRAIGTDPDPSFPVSIKIDAGPIQGRRLLQAMLEREEAGEPIPALTLPEVA
jgi:vanillate O-demethylase monooxygenase subunit